jgi:DNA-binding transcriptional regulator GbsR (MarR family)
MKTPNGERIVKKQTNEHAAITFLRHLYKHCDEGFINFRFLPSAKNLFIPLSNIDSIPAILEANKEQNAYFGVATRVDGDGSKTGILQTPALWVDVDMEGFSEEIPQVENLLQRLASYFSGDRASTDASRILRIPKTLNYKYIPPREVTVMVFKSQKEYNLSDFDFLPEVEDIPHEEERRRLPEGWEKELLGGVNEGERNNAITKLAGRYVGKGLLRDEILPILLDANSRFNPPLPQKEIKICLDSVIKTHQRNHPIEAGKKNILESDRVSNRHNFSLIHVKDLLSTEEPETDWLWDGILPFGGLSLVIAKPKVGKTTFAFNLAVAVSRGDHLLGRKTQKGPVVYLALEEKRREVQKKLSQIGITDEPLIFHFGPAPFEAMQEVIPLIEETGAKLLVIDILQKFCRVKDLNDYAQVTRALEPLMATARQFNCHIQLLHHAGKKDRPDGDDILGSTGLLGGVDTSIHIKKRNKESRVLFTIQRYGEDLIETVVILEADGTLKSTGNREEVEVGETIPGIIEALEEGPLTEKEIWERVGKGHSIVSKALRQLVEQKKINRTGKGKRGDPFIYEKNSLFLSSEYIEESRREIKSNNNPSESLTNISPRDFQKNEEIGEGIGNEISTQQEREKDLSKGDFYGVMDNGQRTY